MGAGVIRVPHAEDVRMRRVALVGVPRLAKDIALPHRVPQASLDDLADQLARTRRADDMPE
ncbi:hypothetical protein Pen02_28690 [Plantactinospora endophytica]|uniref:Uncharacterized protein n=1 Tax=Plantactinospora endophytica TaxID=673535 RepID=A0ABQ4DZT5_9ACTN|nr:hypothetical protein Pen02_28690 [Plantactinospora endophytica]